MYLQSACPFSTLGLIVSEFFPLNSLMSAPAAKAFSPVPVKTTTLTLSSSSACLNISRSFETTDVLSALYLSGRLIVIVAMPSATAYSTSCSDTVMSSMITTREAKDFVISIRNLDTFV